MANSYPENTVCLDKQKYSLGKMIVAGLPSPDGSLGRYNALNRKPLYEAGHRKELELACWQSTHEAEFRPFCFKGRKPHRYREVPSHEIAVNRNEISQSLQLTHKRNFLDNLLPRGNKKGLEEGVPGLDTRSLVNRIPFQDKKEIVGTSPYEIVPRRTDIRRLGRYNLPRRRLFPTL